MLDLDLDLEADLGVDTVKQAEMFAAVREITGFHATRTSNCATIPTLAHVIRFVHEQRPDLAVRDFAAPPSSGVRASACSRWLTQPPVRQPKRSRMNPIKEKVLALVAEKTGYPKDMLDLDLDLEADLGVDTVKQAEMFAAIREIYNIPRDREPQAARLSRPWRTSSASCMTSAPTWLARLRRRPQPASAPAPAPLRSLPAQFQPEAVTDESIKEKVLEIVAEKTGYPKDMLDLDLDLEADLGVDTVKQAEMFAAVRGCLQHSTR